MDIQLNVTGGDYAMVSDYNLQVVFIILILLCTFYYFLCRLKNVFKIKRVINPMEEHKKVKGFL